MSKSKQTKNHFTPRELALVIYYPAVIKFLKSQYNWVDDSAAKIIFERIKTAPVKKHKDTTEFIEIKKIIDSDIIWYAIATNKYSLSFRNWDDIANIPISEFTFKEYPAHKILAHLIYEISWYGMEDSMIIKKKQILNASKKSY